MEHYRRNYKNMILRDYLALDRTKLANERTFLSYIRTFVSFLAMGFGVIKLTDDVAYTYLGVLFCLISPVFLVVGARRFLALRRMFRVLDEKGGGADTKGNPV